MNLLARMSELLALDLEDLFTEDEHFETVIEQMIREMEKEIAREDRRADQEPSSSTTPTSNW